MQYFNDGSIEQACPPLKALLHVMAHGHYDGRTAHDPEFRRMFTRDALLQSDWYRDRLRTRQQRDQAHWERQVYYLAGFTEENGDLHLADRLAYAKRELARVSAPDYLKTLVGTVGADPMK
jgi:hypothetical protein